VLIPCAYPARYTGLIHRDTRGQPTRYTARLHWPSRPSRSTAPRVLPSFVSSLASDGSLAIAILPAGPVDRVVLSEPDSGSLSTQQSFDQATPGASDAAAVTAPADVPSTPPAGGSSDSLPAATSPVVGAAPPVVSGVGSSSPPPPAAAASGAPSGARSLVANVRQGSDHAAPLAVVLLVVGSLAGAGLWVYSGRHRRDMLDGGVSA